MFRVGVRAYVCFLTLLIGPMSAQQPSASSANAVVPSLVKFSGTLTGVKGNTNMVGVTFSLYKESQGGAALWMETQNVQTDKAGHYSVTLGSSTGQGLPANVFANGEARWLGVQAQGQSEQPRVLLMSVPYALKALDAETIGGKPVSAFQLAPQSKNGNSNGSTAPPAEQANEIRCTSGIGCKKNSIPVFTTNGGSAKVGDSIASQDTATDIKIAGTETVTGNISSGGNVSATGNVSGANVAATANVSGANASLSGTSTSTITNSGTSDVLDLTTTGGSTFNTVAFNGTEGFTGSGQTFPLVGFAGSGGSYAVYGSTPTDSNFQAAIYGTEGGTTASTIGVEGVTASPNGAGVYGVNVSGSGVLLGFAPRMGIWGDSSAMRGIMGTSDSNEAVIGVSNSSTVTAFFDNESTGTTDPVFQTFGFNVGGSCSIDTSGDFACTGSKSAVVPVDNGARKVALYAEEAPENWFEDAGSAHLSNGEAVVNIDRVYGQSINTEIEYHVFLTPNGDCRGLYVAQKTPTSFVVRELGGGTSGIGFDYRIMAKRKGYENVRLADMTKRFQRPPEPSGWGNARAGKVMRVPLPPAPPTPKHVSQLRPTVKTGK
jgi:hypothetical protein